MKTAAALSNARHTNPGSRLQVEVIHGIDRERSLSLVVKLPRSVDLDLDAVAHVAVSALKRRRQVGRQLELEGVGGVAGRVLVGVLKQTTSACQQQAVFYVSAAQLEDTGTCMSTQPRHRQFRLVVV